MNGNSWLQLLLLLFMGDPIGGGGLGAIWNDAVAAGAAPELADDPEVLADEDEPPEERPSHHPGGGGGDSIFIIFTIYLFICMFTKLEFSISF